MKEKTAFIEIFGNYPLIRVLDFLLTFREYDYSLSEIAKNSGVGWTTLNRIFPHLLKKEIIKETRRIGRARLFKLNEKNDIVKQLIKIYNIAIVVAGEKEGEGQRAKVEARVKR